MENHRVCFTCAHVYTCSVESVEIERPDSSVELYPVSKRSCDFFCCTWQHNVQLDRDEIALVSRVPYFLFCACRDYHPIFLNSIGILCCHVICTRGKPHYCRFHSCVCTCVHCVFAEHLVYLCALCDCRTPCCTPVRVCICGWHGYIVTCALNK